MVRGKGQAPADSGSTGLQGASEVATNPSDEPVVQLASDAEEQQDADSNTREQGSASGYSLPPVQGSDQGPTRRVTRSTSLGIPRRTVTTGATSSEEYARARSTSQSRAEGAAQQPEAAKGRRRLPEPDLDAIEDPQERQRQQRLARIRASAAVAREKKRQDMEDMGVRADALQQENQRLRLMLAQRDQETLRLRQQVGRMRGGGDQLRLPPPQVGAPLPDLAAIAAGRYGGVAPSAGPQASPSAGGSCPEGGQGMPEQGVAHEPAAFFFVDSLEVPPLGTARGSLGGARQQLPPLWAPAAGGQPSRLQRAYPPAAIPDLPPEMNPGAPAGAAGFVGLHPLPGEPYPPDYFFNDPAAAAQSFPGAFPLGARGAVPLEQPAPGPVGQAPQAEPGDGAGSLGLPSGVIYGVDGQWIRLRPGVNPAPPHSPPPAGRGRGRGSPP